MMNQYLVGFLGCLIRSAIEFVMTENERLIEPLVTASRCGDLDTMKTLLDRGVDIDGFDKVSM